MTAIIVSKVLCKKCGKDYTQSFLTTCIIYRHRVQNVCPTCIKAFLSSHELPRPHHS